MFHLIFSLPSWYAIVRFIGPLPWPPAVKVVVALLMLISSQYLLFSKFSSGSAMSPEMPRAVIILFNWAFSTVLFIAISQLLLDAVTLIALLFQHPLEMVPAVRYVLGTGAMIVAAFGVYQAIRVPPVKDIIIEVKNLSRQFEGYQLLQLTDLHISRLFNSLWTARLVKRANALSVDLIVITGDVIDGTLANRKRDVDPLRGLQAPDGVFTITGNHEYFFEQQVWTEHLDSLGMKPLINSHTVIERRGENLVLAGVTDLSAPRSGFPGPDLGKALAGAPQDAAVMLLDHQPRNARLNAAQGVGGQLSGHTHGGLIAGFDRLFARANGGFVSGHYEVDGMSLYVNNGTALWPGMAIRLGRPSELTRITLTLKN
ncbi:putative MPP superfamily phosphohydrolase [Erwinia toletana]|uniref:MPP superfamily phosphohydrolase n=1 Tax=Winslowiella toletana TaxID=92490 RepID=A0ABS4PFD7_9GAMM|nr:metallophosphoesterase [Winslowiella toletana]MBP2171345.1 putative MPP superfamily phosphohydrolase [Winslowiella toletana]